MSGASTGAADAALCCARVQHTRPSKPLTHGLLHRGWVHLEHLRLPILAAGLATAAAALLRGGIVQEAAGEVGPAHVPAGQLRRGGVAAAGGQVGGQGGAGRKEVAHRRQRGVGRQRARARGRADGV